jgi:hypothetical protein
MYGTQVRELLQNILLTVRFLIPLLKRVARGHDRKMDWGLDWH